MIQFRVEIFIAFQNCAVKYVEVESSNMSKTQKNFNNHM